VNAAGQLAELLDRKLHLLGTCGEQALDLRVGATVEVALGSLQIERERDQPLLRAVVEVALDSAALLVAGGHDACTRFLDLDELGLQLRLQPGILERESCSCGSGVDQLRLVAEGRIVDQSRERLVVVLEVGDRAVVPVLRKLDGQAVGVDIPAALGQPEGDLERRVVQSLGERVADLARRRLLEPEDEVADVRMGEAGPDETEEERDRERDQPDDLPPEDVVCDEGGRPSGERDHAVVDGPERGDHDPD
jgi:hypothetical protein